MSPVRNIRGIGGTKPIPIYHAIPPVGDANFKVIIEAASDIDLSDLIVSGSWSDGVTNIIGDFEFKIIDPDKAIYNQVSKLDEIVIYADYGTPTTARFRGKIEVLGYTDSYLNISGRSIGMIFAEKNIIYTSNGVKAKSSIIKEIIAANFTGIDVDNVIANSTEIEVNYDEIPFSEIIAEICGDGYDFYLNHDSEAHYFVKGSRVNTTEIIAEESNLLGVANNAYDTSYISSKVRVYGTNKGFPVIATSDIGTTETGGITKEFKIDNNSIKTMQQAIDFVDAEAEKRKTTPKISEVSSLILPSILPGEKLFIIIPREEIDPEYYEINSFKHEVDLGSEYYLKTTVNIKKQKTNISTILKGRINFENKISENLNKYDLDFSYVWDFDTDTGTHTSTTIEINTNTGEGVLKTTGGATGEWESDLLTLDSNVTAVQLKSDGEVNEGTQLFLSTNGGTTYTPIIAGTTTIPAGQDIKLKVVLNSASTRLKAIVLYYSL